MRLSKHFTPVCPALPTGHHPGQSARPGLSAKIIRIALCLTLGTACLCPPVLARQQSPAVAMPTRTTAQLLNDLDDINELRGLNPLKLAPEQIDRIIGAISSAQQAYETRLKAL